MSATSSHSSKTKEYIEKARAKHGERYDYSRTVYVRSRDKIVITCLEHGEFEQMASNHLKGNGCAKCGARRGSQSSTEEFIRKARVKHGDRYDYSRSAYTGQLDKLEILCSIHGVFLQRPFAHLQGCGCQKCAKAVSSRSRTTKEFITESNARHDDYYSYQKTRYSRGDSKVIITCPKHGDFEQVASSHLAGSGCRVCRGERKTDEFICKAKNRHGDSYLYSKVKYARWSTPVTITCPEHGDFEQRPDHHLAGKGCIKCGKTARLTTSEFIDKAVQVHGEKYDYSEARYVNGKALIAIKCPEHGRFKQRATNHLTGNGCSLCPAEYRYGDPTSIYLMAAGELIKVGYSVEPEARLSDLNRAHPFNAELLKTWLLQDMPTARSAESTIHRKLARHHAGLSGFDGATEWFRVAPEHAAIVINKVVSKFQ